MHNRESRIRIRTSSLWPPRWNHLRTWYLLSSFSQRCPCTRAIWHDVRHRTVQSPALPSAPTRSDQFPTYLSRRWKCKSKCSSRKPKTYKLGTRLMLAFKENHGGKKETSYLCRILKINWLHEEVFGKIPRKNVRSRNQSSLDNLFKLVLNKRR